MDQVQQKILNDTLSAFAEKLDLFEKKIDQNTPVQKPVLTLKDFRTKRSSKEKRKKRTRARLISLYTGIYPEQANYLEAILLRLFEVTGIKWNTADIARGMVDSFMQNHSVDAAFAWMDEGKSKYMVRSGV